MSLQSPVFNRPYIPALAVILLLLLEAFSLSAAAQNSDLLRQGLDRLAEQDTSGALATFSHANPQDATAHYNVGTLALERGDFGVARFHLEAASRLAPFSEPITHNLSLSHRQLGIT